MLSPAGVTIPQVKADWLVGWDTFYCVYPPEHDRYVLGVRASYSVIPYTHHSKVQTIPVTKEHKEYVFGVT